MQESDFARNLQRICYCDGKIDGYTFARIIYPTGSIMVSAKAF